MQHLMVRSKSERQNSAHGGVFQEFIKKTTDRTLRDFKMEDPTKKYKTHGSKLKVGQSYDKDDTMRSKNLSSGIGPFQPNKSRSGSKGGNNDKGGNNNDKAPPKISKIGVLKKNNLKIMGNKYGTKAVNLLTKEDELRAIKSRNAMKKWIARHKHTGIKWGDNSQNELDATEKVKHTASKGCSRRCNQWITNLRAMFRKEEFHREIPLHLPMYAWTWQHLVSFIENEEQYKKFSSIVWEYRITGQEICNMKSKQIELLIECSVLNNSKLFETEFDEYKLLSSRSSFYQTDPDAKDFDKHNKWGISVEADELYEYIVKGRVQSQIVSRYFTAWDIVTKIAHDVDHPCNQKASNVVDLVTILRAEPCEGPKKFWYVFI